MKAQYLTSFTVWFRSMIVCVRLDTVCCFWLNSLWRSPSIMSQTSTENWNDTLYFLKDMCRLNEYYPVCKDMKKQYKVNVNAHEKREKFNHSMAFDWPWILATMKCSLYGSSMFKKRGVLKKVIEDTPRCFLICFNSRRPQECSERPALFAVPGRRLQLHKWYLVGSWRGGRWLK